jgi:hypothetical protein
MNYQNLTLDELSNLNMDQIDLIVPGEYSKLSKEQINSLPVLPLGLRISIALTPPEQVASQMLKLSQEQLDEYPTSFISSFTPDQINALPSSLQTFFASKIEKGLKVLEELYLSKSTETIINEE